MKCVMIVNENLPRGIIANTTAALGISIASLQDGMTGKKLMDRNGRIHESITNVPEYFGLIVPSSRQNRPTFSVV